VGAEGMKTRGLLDDGLDFSLLLLQFNTHVMSGVYSKTMACYISCKGLRGKVSGRAVNYTGVVNTRGITTLL